LIEGAHDRSGGGFHVGERAERTISGIERLEAGFAAGD
jgi:hypothetical protein